MVADVVASALATVSPAAPAPTIRTSASYRVAGSAATEAAGPSGKRPRQAMRRATVCIIPDNPSLMTGLRTYIGHGCDIAIPLYVAFKRGRVKLAEVFFFGRPLVKLAIMLISAGFLIDVLMHAFLTFRYPESQINNPGLLEFSGKLGNYTRYIDSKILEDSWVKK